MLAGGFRFIDHTGDLAFEVWAEAMPELLRLASEALNSAVLEPDQVEEKILREWSLQAESAEGLLVQQLSEMVFLMESESWAFSRFEIQCPSPLSLLCRAWGETLEPTRHRFKTAVKAVTYHQLKITRNPQGLLHAVVVIDI